MQIYNHKNYIVYYNNFINIILKNNYNIKKSKKYNLFFKIAI